jgi:hypothetical protein
MFVLRSYTDHQADPTVIPDEAALSEAAGGGGEDYLTAMIAGKGLA